MMLTLIVNLLLLLLTEILPAVRFIAFYVPAYLFLLCLVILGFTNELEFNVFQHHCQVETVG